MVKEIIWNSDGIVKNKSEMTPAPEERGQKGKKMEYIVIEDCGTDCFTKEFNNLEEARRAAKDEFSRLTPSDLKRYKAFYILKSANPNEDAENHMDGEILKRFVFTQPEYLALEKAVETAGENVTADYIKHNIELGYLDIVEGRSGRAIADYMDMDDHVGRVYVDTLTVLTAEEVEKELF